MKTALWIPCYNEGTQDLFHANEDYWGPMPEDGHLLKRTLELLREKIISGIFGHIIITNDGCTDDTEEGLIKFIRENGLPRNKFRILGDQGRENNQGKTMRFFEAVDYATKELQTERLIMTDADMLSIGGDTFPKLAKASSEAMEISFQGEWYRKSYCFSGSRTSGTRSINIGAMQKSFEENGIKGEYFEHGCGFGLESLLNRTLPYQMTQGLTPYNETNTPLFLKPLRRKIHIQGLEIQKTENILDEMGLKEK